MVDLFQIMDVDSSKLLFMRSQKILRQGSPCKARWLVNWSHWAFSCPELRRCSTWNVWRPSKHQVALKTMSGPSTTELLLSKSTAPQKL